MAILPFRKGKSQAEAVFERLQGKCQKRKKGAPGTFSCRPCGEFAGCLEICLKAEEYVSQDEVQLREETIGVPVITEPVNFNVGKPVKFTRREREIVTLQSVHKLSRGEIAKYLKISRAGLRQHLARIRRKIPSGSETSEEKK